MLKTNNQPLFPRQRGKGANPQTDIYFPDMCENVRTDKKESLFSGYV
jgi:hypothetical protein